MVTLSLGSVAVMLRDPDFGNNEKLTFQKVVQRSVNNDLIVYRDPSWPMEDILDLRFSYLNQKQVQDLLNFMNYSLGQQITYVDHEGRTWHGVITTPAGEVSQPAREGFSAQFSFQGVLA
jgi:hypothetical protein